MSSNSRFASLALGPMLLVALVVTGCASAGHQPGDDDDSPSGADAGGNGPTIDAGQVIGPDAAPGTPDASPAGSPDAGPTQNVCTLFPQSGCTEPSPACDLGGGTAPACRAVTAQGTDTSLCANLTSCAVGYSCINFGTASSCLRYCGADADCGGGAGAACAITLVDDSMVEIPNVTLCSQACSPFSTNEAGCPSGFSCQANYVAELDKAHTICLQHGAGVNNAACTSNSQCAAGFTCINTGTATKCKKYCNVNTSNTCGGGLSCVGLSVDAGGTPLVIAGVTYGVCN